VLSGAEVSERQVNFAFCVVRPVIPALCYNFGVPTRNDRADFRPHGHCEKLRCEATEPPAGGELVKQSPKLPESQAEGLLLKN
jgi:hypothetical protein